MSALPCCCINPVNARSILPGTLPETTVAPAGSLGSAQIANSPAVAPRYVQPASAQAVAAALSLACVRIETPTGLLSSGTKAIAIVEKRVSSAAIVNHVETR